MTDAIEDMDFDNFYVKEISKSDIKDLVKEFEKSFVKDNVSTLDINDREVKDLVASKFIVINEDFYFGINETYAYCKNGTQIDIYENTNALRDFANDLPEDVDLGFGTFSLHLEEEDLDINFDDRGEVNYIKEKFYSYETDLDLGDFEKLGEIEFDNGNSLEIYENGFYAGKYKTGRSEKTVVINSDCMDALFDIVNQALRG